MNIRTSYGLLLTFCAMLVAGCASSGQSEASQKEDTRLYQADRSTAINAVATAMAGLGLAVGEGAEFDERTYVLRGKEMRSAEGGSPPIQVGAVDVYVERAADGISRVRIDAERIRRGSGGLGGGSDGSLGNALRKDYPERIFNALDEKLQAVSAEEAELKSRR